MRTSSLQTTDVFKSETSCVHETSTEKAKAINGPVDQAHAGEFLLRADDVLANPNLVGAASLTCLLLGLVVWASVAPLASAVMTTGTVVVAENIKTVQTQDGGVIETVDVRDGDFVQKGQRVAGFRSETQKSLANALALSVTENYLEQARLRAEMVGQKFEPAPMAARLIEDNVYVHIAEEQDDLFRTQVHNQNVHVAQIQSEIAGLTSSLREIGVEKTELSKRLALAAEDTSAAAKLARDGIGTMKAHRDAEAAEAMLVGDWASLLTHEADVSQQIRHLQLESLHAKLSFREATALELQKLYVDEQDLRIRYVQASTNLAQTIVHSPVSGIVINETVHTIGGVVLPGATLLEVVPSGQNLVVESQVRPIDIDDVVVGSPVNIHEEGRVAEAGSELQGRVLSVSADRIVDTEKSDPYFLVKIGVEKLPNTRAIKVLKPGMALDVIIRKQSQTLLQYLFRPIERAFFHSMRE